MNLCRARFLKPAVRLSLREANRCMRPFVRFARLY